MVAFFQLRAVIAITCSIFAHAHLEQKIINLGQQTGFWQGDIKLNPRQRNGILKTKRWTNGVIPYSINTAGYNLNQVDTIIEAMRTIERSTCIQFIQKTNQTNHLVIFKDRDKCYSTGIGMQGRQQKVSLGHDAGSTCLTHSIVVHELLHAIGLNHEQMRLDRDQYITIHSKNLRDKKDISQFNIAPLSENNDYGIPYNYASVMHYDAWGFGDGGIVMEPKNPSMLSVMGFAAYANETDFEKVRRIYDCNGTYTPAPNPTKCEDWDSDLCLRFAHNCSTDQLMSKICRQTCGFCKWGQTLKPFTRYPWCEDWKSGCDHVKDCKSPIYSRFCQYTCGICDKSKTNSPTTLNPKAVTNSYCEDKSSVDCNIYSSLCGESPWLKKACPYTCGFCDKSKTRNPPPVCKDQLSNCEKTKCDDWNNGIALKCRLTCGLCDGAATPKTVG